MASSPARPETLGGLLRVAAAGVVWGTIPLALRVAEGAPTVKVFYRVLFGSAALALYAALSGRLGEFRLSRRQLGMLLGQGAILTLNWFLFFGALDRATVATAELLGYTGPVFVAVLAPFVSREPFERAIIAPLVLALGGIAVILAPHGIEIGSRTELVGAGMAFASSLTYATLLLRSKRILREVATLPLMVVEYTFASVVLLPVALTQPGPSTAKGFAALAYLGLVCTAGSGLLFITGLRRVRTDHAAILTYAEPVSAVLFAALLLGEALTWPTVLGGAMVVAGGVLVARLQPSTGTLEAPGGAGLAEEEAPGPGVG